MTEADWLTSPDAVLRVMHEHASPRKLLLAQLIFVRRAEADPAYDEAKRCSDLIETQADDPRPLNELKEELYARPGLWSLTQILGYDTADRLAMQIRKDIALFRLVDPYFAAEIIREVVGNPFRPVAFDPAWRTEAAVGLARGMYESRDFAPMPVLADALEDAGCADPDVPTHCREPGAHVRGCWVVDLVLGKS